MKNMSVYLTNINVHTYTIRNCIHYTN